MKRFLFVLLVFLYILTPVCQAADNWWSVEVKSIDKKVVMETIIADYLNMGWQIKSSSDYQLIFRRDVDDFWGQVLYGSRFNTTPEVRTQFNFIQQGSDVKITAEAKIVTNPNSGFEHYTSYTGDVVPNYLNSLRSYFNGYVGYGITYDKQGDKYKLVRISHGSSAEQAGLNKGDIICEVNKKSTKEVWKKEMLDILSAGGEGTTVTFGIETPSGVKTVTLTKSFIPPEYKPSAAAPSTTQQSSASKLAYGLGFAVNSDNGVLIITSVIKGSSAEIAGLKAGDMIASINDTPVNTMTADQIKGAFSNVKDKAIKLGKQTSNETITVVLMKSPLDGIPVSQLSDIY